MEKAKALQAYYTGEIQLDELQEYRARQEFVTEYDSVPYYATMERDVSEPTLQEEQPNEESFYTEQPRYEQTEQQLWEHSGIEQDEDAGMAAYQRLMKEAANLVEQTNVPTYEETVYTEEMPQERTWYEANYKVNDETNHVAYEMETASYEEETTIVKETTIVNDTDTDVSMQAYEELMRKAAMMEETEEAVEQEEEPYYDQAEQELLRYLEESGVVLEEI